MSGARGQGYGLMVALLMSIVLTGCASRGMGQAPVEDRGTGVGLPAPPPRPAPVPQPAPVETAVPVVRPAPGAENAGKPGFYTVKPGDTLIRISLDTGSNWRDLARWNGIDNPNRIEVGQVLRVTPPGAPVTDAVGVPVARPVQSGTVLPTPIAGTPVAGTPTVSSPIASTPRVTASTGSAVVTATPPVGSPPAASSPPGLAWGWPANTGLIAGFDEVKNKGLDFGGNSGDAVLASADGIVVFAGVGPRGYGNLIILKHNDVYLSAYAHNQNLLVKEDQSVRRGQKIAEMGNSDADRIKLHFEIRQNGKPVDPALHLPKR